MELIPRILHQTWRSIDLPHPLQAFRESWRRHHPSWRHCMYDDDSCRRLVSSMSSQYLALYDALPTAIQRADLFRYLVVFEFGGVYVDIDMECYRNVDRLLFGADCVLSEEAHVTARRQQELGYGKPLQLANCVFAARPKHPFLKTLIERVAMTRGASVVTDDDIEDTTGPRMLTRLYYQLAESEQRKLRVLPQIYLLAPWEIPRVPFVGPPIYARHHAVGTWKQTRRRSSLRRWLIERNRLPELWPRGAITANTTSP